MQPRSRIAPTRKDEAGQRFEPGIGIVDRAFEPCDLRRDDPQHHFRGREIVVFARRRR